MARRLRIGIIGLGRRWPRYRRALGLLGDEVRAVAVYDAAPARAEQEARELGCACVGGVMELIERADVQAILLAGSSWHGLWALEQAARVDKPVLCAVSPLADEAHAESLRATLSDHPRLHFALWPTLTLLRESVAERLQDTLGQPVLVQATWTRPQAPTSSSVLALLLECVNVFGLPPTRITSHHAADLTSLLLHFDANRTAQVTLWSSPAARASCTLQVEAENGSIRAEWPNRVEWTDGDARHQHELPGGLAEMVVLDRFVQAVRRDEPADCRLEHVCAALDWLRQARPA